jgi:hypothetical protein
MKSHMFGIGYFTILKNYSLFVLIVFMLLADVLLLCHHIAGTLCEVTMTYQSSSHPCILSGHHVIFHYNESVFLKCT